MWVGVATVVSAGVRMQCAMVVGGVSEVRWSIVRWWRPFPLCRPRTVVWNRQEWRRKYWATRSSVYSFARTAHSFACSGLLVLLAPSAALTCSLACSLRSLPRLWESEFFMSQNDLVLSHSAVPPLLLENYGFRSFDAVKQKSSSVNSDEPQFIGAFFFQKKKEGK